MDILETVKVTVPNLQWYGDEPLVLEFPANWEVRRCGMACEDQPGMTEDQIRAALMSPIGSKPLCHLAKDCEEAAIIIDDMTRPTKSSQYVSHILAALRKAGVPRDNVRFIMAGGS
ncbi:MAG: lactate racemase domain-containing protein, partial [Candidatus Bathyarchaeia archaeon]